MNPWDLFWLIVAGALGLVVAGLLLAAAALGLYICTRLVRDALREWVRGVSPR